MVVAVALVVLVHSISTNPIKIIVIVMLRLPCQPIVSTDLTLSMKVSCLMQSS